MPYVRWTAARNFEAVLESLASGAIDVRPLVTHRQAHADAAYAYDAILRDSETLGVVLSYPRGAPPVARVMRLHPTVAATSSSPARPVVGVIGAGNFTRQVLLPAIKAAGATIKAVASAGGVTSLHAARKFAADQATSDYQEVLRAPEINAVFVATRHDTHARMVVEALEAGKHVFVEKPLALDPQGLDLVRGAYAAHSDRLLMVGFNRRFAPHAIKAQQLLAGRSQPIAVRIVVNAGEIPATHWARDPVAGGGRIVGEACHFIDLALFLVGHAITGVQAISTTHMGGSDASTSVGLTFEDGSIASIDYWTNGPRSYPKERIEIFSEGRVLTIDNWRALRAHEWPGVSRMRMRQDKGHGNEVAAFLRGVATGGEPLIPFEEIAMVTAASFAAVQSATEGMTIRLAAPTTQQSHPQQPRSLAPQRRHNETNTRRKIILYELNEVPWRILDDFVREHRQSCLARLLPQMQQYQTYANDTSLSPWISWPSLHRGVSDEQHTISDLGQDLWEINAAYPAIWEILTRAHIPTGVFGSLHSYPLPANVSDYSFYIPDVFAAGSECFPEYLQGFQALNLEMTRSSGRNVSTKLSWQKALRLLRDAPGFGLKPNTLLEVGLQVVDERRRRWTRVRRRTYQVVLAFDIFMKQLEDSKPVFSTFFTNHVASSLHRYWAARYPHDYREFSYTPEWVTTYQNEVMWTMSKADEMLRRLVKFISRNPGYSLWIASSMGQAATEANEAQTQVYLTNVDTFMQRLGFAAGDWEVRPAMLPRVIVALKNGKAPHLRAKAHGHPHRGQRVAAVEEDQPRRVPHPPRSTAERPRGILRHRRPARFVCGDRLRQRRDPGQRRAVRLPHSPGRAAHLRPARATDERAAAGNFDLGYCTDHPPGLWCGAARLHAARNTLPGAHPEPRLTLSIAIPDDQAVTHHIEPYRGQFAEHVEPAAGVPPPRLPVIDEAGDRIVIHLDPTIRQLLFQHAESATVVIPAGHDQDAMQSAVLGKRSSLAAIVPSAGRRENVDRFSRHSLLLRHLRQRLRRRAVTGDPQFRS